VKGKLIIKALETDAFSVADPTPADVLKQSGARVEKAKSPLVKSFQTSILD